MPTQEIEAIKQKLIDEVKPLRIYLFGSYAEGRQREDSDFDFYLLVDDNAGRIVDITANAYSAIRSVRQHPVDIVVGTVSRFEQRKTWPTLEKEVFKKGVLLYG